MISLTIGNSLAAECESSFDSIHLNRCPTTIHMRPWLNQFDFMRFQWLFKITSYPTNENKLHRLALKRHVLKGFRHSGVTICSAFDVWRCWCCAVFSPPLSAKYDSLRNELGHKHPFICKWKTHKNTKRTHLDSARHEPNKKWMAKISLQCV